jgi:hypothetical protein
MGAPDGPLGSKGPGAGAGAGSGTAAEGKRPWMPVQWNDYAKILLVSGPPGCQSYGVGLECRVLALNAARSAVACSARNVAALSPRCLRRPLRHAFCRISVLLRVFVCPCVCVDQAWVKRRWRTSWHPTAVSVCRK